MMVSKCAICGGKVEEKEISEEVRTKNDFVVIENVRAGVCLECGERYYPPGVVDRLREIERSIIEGKRPEKLDMIGNAYRIEYNTIT
jgi:YgiT-type zinc finger domain-containing protein